MSVRLGAGALSVALGATISGLICGTTVQAQTPSTGKAVVSSSAPSSSSSPPADGVSSSNPKAKVAAPDPPAGGGSVPQDSKAPTPQTKTEDAYVVGVADSLLISVWKEPDFSGPVVVRPDGVITVPVVGDVHVAGLTTTQVQEALTEKLK